VVIDIAPKGAPRRQVTRTLPQLNGDDPQVSARAFVSQTRERLARGQYTAPSKITIRDLADDYLRSRRDIREVTVNGYRDALGPVLDRIGDRPAQSITRPEIDALMESLESEGGRRAKKLSHRTLVYALGTLRQVLAYGVSAGVLFSNPAADVRARRKRNTDHTPVMVWEPVQLHQFVAQVDTDTDEWVRVGFRLTACGLRRSEVLGLAWSNVDLDAGTVRVQASRVKTGTGYETSRDDTKSPASTRTVAVEQMHPGTIAAMRALRAHQAGDRLAAGPAWSDSGLVIVDALGNGIHPEVYSLRWRSLVKAADLPIIRLHAVRHTIALALHRAGVAPADAASMLGHTVGTHLSFYVPSTETGAATAAARLGEVMAQAR
jgi:integrase